MERAEIGFVCFKGPHISFKGEEDYGACRGKSFAKVYVSVEVEHPNPRSEDFTALDAAEAIRREVESAAAHQWCSYRNGEVSELTAAQAELSEVRSMLESVEYYESKPHKAVRDVLAVLRFLDGDERDVEG